MNPLSAILEHLTGMHTLTDQVIAMDCLIDAKSGVRNLAMAVTEAGTPEVKAVLVKHLDETIDMYERIVSYVMDKGMYHPWNVQEQIRFDLQTIDTALKAPTL